MICWNCHKDTMEVAPKLGEGWYQCSKCGATTSDRELNPKKKRKVKK